MSANTCQGVSSSLAGVGIAKYHDYASVGDDPCIPACGLRPRAFGMMAAAVSFAIHDQLPFICKAGRRGGPYYSESRCVRVTPTNDQGPGYERSITVRIIDKCCDRDLGNSNKHHIDLSQEAFGRLGPTAQGNIQVRWEVVDCPVSLTIQDASAVCDNDYYYCR